MEIEERGLEKKSSSAPTTPVVLNSEDKSEELEESAEDEIENKKVLKKREADKIRIREFRPTTRKFRKQKTPPSTKILENKNVPTTSK